MGHLIALAMALVAADGISIDLDAIEFGADPEPTICWMAPRKFSREHRIRLERAIVRAAMVTRPAHVTYPVRRVRSLEDFTEGCRGFVRVHIKVRGRRQARVVVRLKDTDGGLDVRVASFGVALRSLKRQHFESAWRKAWEGFAPPAPPPPPEPPPEPPSKPYFDGELTGEAATFVPPEAPPEGPLVSVWIDAGWTGRRLQDAPGVEQSDASMPSAGGRLTLHGARIFRWPSRHELDLTIGYWRRFVSGDQGGFPLSVLADRAEATARYRYQLGSFGPRVGPSVGYAFTRFESNGTSVLSTRFSVLRAGIAVSQPVWRWSTAGGLWLEADASARWNPGGGTDLGFDVGGGAVVRLDWGLMFAVEARWTQQPGEVSGTAFVDETLETLAAVGWAL